MPEMLRIYIVCVGKFQEERTFFFFSSSAERSSRAFSCDLRFFRSVSGTRICSWVGVERLSEGIVAVVEVELLLVKVFEIKPKT